MKCPNKNCNADNPQGAKYCNQCGTKLETTQKCPYPDCGTDHLPAMAKFCPDCGRPLDSNMSSEKPKDNERGEEKNKVPSDFVLVEGGTFQMGSNEYSDESPVHSVTLSDYYIGKYQVTQKLWTEVMGNNPSRFKGDDLPVEQVSWFDCISFCNALSRRDGWEECYHIDGQSVKFLSGKHGYRLPTEAEWEFAARGGKMSKGFEYAGSNSLDEVAWHDGNSEGKTHPVGQKRANELGLFDMSGNVWEWCWDWKAPYPSSFQTNPLGPDSGTYRVDRGGSWNNSASNCRVARRSNDTPTNRRYYLGFRLVFVF